MEAVNPVLVLTQAAVSGLLVGLAIFNVLWRRADGRNKASRWLTAWCATLAALFGLNAILPLSTGEYANVILFARSQVLAASVVLIIPVFRAWFDTPRVRGLVPILTAAYAARGVLWLTTDLIYEHSYTEGLPDYGAALIPSFLVPTGVVVVYLVVAAFSGERAPWRTWIIITAIAGLGVLITSYALPTGVLAEILTAMWAIPIVLVLQVAAVTRLNRVETHASRLRAMRDSLASLANAAWFDRAPDALLARAEIDARTLLGDPEITGYVRRLNRGTFHTAFRTSPGLRQDHAAASFLDDLGHVVSAAADRHELAQELARAALRDALTGLPNRRALDAHLATLLAGPTNDRIAVIFCDLEGFKNINDEYGHPWGDDVLVHTGERLQAIMGKDGFVARFGGDEFVVVVQGSHTDTELVELGCKLRHASVGIPAAHRRALSVGIAVREPGLVREAHTLLRDADTAMYAAKRSPTGVRLFDAELRHRVLADITLRREIQVGFDTGQFEPWFQAIVDTASLKVVALEALLRWPHPNGDREPLDWIQHAEDSGLIVPIGIATVTSARAASDAHGLPVSVNVAARQLAEPELAEQILDAWGTSPLNRLTLEITESALLDDVSRAVSTLHNLRERGVRVAIDDFGTGYSSLARLALLPIDIIKIDQAFVREVTTPRGEKVLKALLDLAAAHGLDVVVEGVETVEEFAIMRRLGVPKVQGFLLARPSAVATTEISHSALNVDAGVTPSGT